MNTDRKIVIECPVCSTTNNIILEKRIENSELVCIDCQFRLASLTKSVEMIERCIFCNNNYFYFEHQLWTFFLRKDIVCYTCEAKYINIKVLGDIQKYNEEEFKVAKETKEAKDWYLRVKVS